VSTQPQTLLSCFVIGIIRHFFSLTALVHIYIPHTYTPCGRVTGSLVLHSQLATSFLTLPSLSNSVSIRLSHLPDYCTWHPWLHSQGYGSQLHNLSGYSFAYLVTIYYHMINYLSIYFLKLFIFIFHGDILLYPCKKS
jgi:hypothetical protein